MSGNLLPCPFCGENAELVEEHDHFWVQHKSCPVDIGAFEDGSEAVSAWNRRTPSPNSRMRGIDPVERREE